MVLSLTSWGVLRPCPTDGDADLRPRGVPLPDDEEEDDFFSIILSQTPTPTALSWVALKLCTLVLDPGLTSSDDDDDDDFFVVTFVSYGLKPSGFDSAGLLRVRSTFVAGGDLVFEPEITFDGFSNGDIIGFVGESAPIWLHVWARRASGLFLASNCKIENNKNNV